MRIRSRALARCHFLAVMAMVLPSLLSGCGNATERNLQSAKSITIRYQMGEETKLLPITEAKEVQNIVSTIDISGTPDNAFTGVPDHCVVVFEYDESKTVEAKFLRADWLQIEKVGNVRLKRAFYEKICERISKVEGRAIDALRENASRTK